MASSFPVGILILSREVGYLCKFDWTRQNVTNNNYCGKFVNEIAYWLIVFGKCFSLVKNSSEFLTYSFDKLLMFFWITLVGIFYLKYDFWLYLRKLISLLHQRYNVGKYTLTWLRCWCWRIYACFLTPSLNFLCFFMITFFILLNLNNPF